MKGEGSVFRARVNGLPGVSAMTRRLSSSVAIAKKSDKLAVSRNGPAQAREGAKR